MRRPQKVQDAIVRRPDGLYVGRYKDFGVRSAYQPIFRPCEQGNLEIAAYEGLARIFRGASALPPTDMFGTTETEDLLFVNSLCNALHIRNYPEVLPASKTLFLNFDPYMYRTIDQLELELGFTLKQLPKYGLQAESVVVEILESQPYCSRVLLRMREFCRQHGLRFALDDYGQAESNFLRYETLQPDIVKLDGFLTRRLCHDGSGQKILKSMVAQFHANGVQVLIEGIETAQETEAALEAHVDMLQGFYLERPQLLPCEFKENLSREKEAVSNLAAVS